MSSTVYHEDKEFKNIDYSEKTLRDREFSKCTFISCNFTNSDLRDNNFEDCVFENCNFSMTLIGNVGLSNVVFTNCKILGVDVKGQFGSLITSRLVLTALCTEMGWRK